MVPKPGPVVDGREVVVLVDGRVVVLVLGRPGPVNPSEVGELVDVAEV